MKSRSEPTSQFDTFQDGRHRSVPAHYELRGTSDYSFPVLSTSQATSMWVLASALLANEWCDHSEIEARQLGQLRSLLQFAAQRSPFYASRIRACGLDPGAVRRIEEFRRMPLLTRADLQDNFEQIRCRDLPPSTQVRGELATSGSTGSPVRLLSTNITSLMWVAMNVRDHVWAGLDPHGSLVSIRHCPEGTHQAHTEEGLRVDNWGGSFGGSFCTGPAYLMDIGQDVEAQLALLIRADADYLLSYPSNLEALGKVLVEREVNLPRLKLIMTVGEVLLQHVRHRIEAAFKTRVWDLYSCVEVGYLASQCPRGEGYHVHEENVLFELLNEDNEPCEPGEPGKVVVTALMNYASPIIRSDLGDYAVAMSEPCPCGRGLMGLKEIIGRQRGQLRLPDGRVKYNAYLSAVLRDVGQVRQFQVIQHSRDRVEVFIVPMEGFGDEEKRKITEEFHTFFECPIQVSFTLVPRIERTVGGKYLDFVCKVT